jgi:DEAD/DEAH box helicase domain-containing protein
MAENFVYFDLETQRSANDVGGWDRKADMGMSIGVTFSSALNRYMIYDEANVQALIDELRDADLVIGFNHVSFDYEVLMGYTVLDLRDCTRNLDLMVDLEKTLLHRPKLDAVASESAHSGSPSARRRERIRPARPSASFSQLRRARRK